MIFENINLQDERLKKEQKTLRFKRVMNRWEALSTVCDAELEHMLREIYKADEKSFVPPPHDGLYNKNLPGFMLYRGEARIIQVFTIEAELIMRNSELNISIDDIIALYMKEVETLRREHWENQNQVGKTDDYGSADQQDQFAAKVTEDKDATDWFDLAPSFQRRPTTERMVEQKLYKEWLRMNFPITRFADMMDVELALKVFNWLTYMYQEFAEKFFRLDNKSIIVFSMIVLQGMKQKEVAQVLGETAGAICKRFDKIILHLYGRSKKQIKEERRRQAQHRKEYKKQISRIKKEYAAEQKVRMEALVNPEVHLYKYE